MAELSPTELAEQALTRAAWAAYEAEQQAHLEAVRRMQELDEYHDGIRRNRAVHGTRAMYQKPNRCRCDLCVQANREYIQAYKKSKGWEPKQRKPSTHGTLHMYQNKGCRCAACVGAAKQWRLERGITKSKRKTTIDIAPPEHGTESRYRSRKHGPCRCDLCREAANAARRKRARKAIDKAQSE